jgi:hypothetical protein
VVRPSMPWELMQSGARCQNPPWCVGPTMAQLPEARLYGHVGVLPATSPTPRPT